MTRYVLDASVAAKWILPGSGEPLASEAMNICADYAAGRTELSIPGFFWAEIGNILWKAVRHRRTNFAAAHEGLMALSEYGLPEIPTRDLLKDASQIAHAFDRPVYDAIYLALALSLGCEMLTADEKLVNAVGSRLPVRWLGAVR